MSRLQQRLIACHDLDDHTGPQLMHDDCVEREPMHRVGDMVSGAKTQTGSPFLDHSYLDNKAHSKEHTVRSTRDP